MLPHRLVVFGLIGTLLLSSAPALAQKGGKAPLPPATSPEAMTLELGLFGGIFLPSDRHELYDPRLPHQTFDSPGADIGLRAAFFPTRFFGVEAEGALLPLSLQNGGGATGYSVRGHAILQYPARITPFAVVGGGVLGVNSANDEVGDDSDGAFHWGLGAKAYLTDLFNLRLDGRHLVAPSLDEAGSRNDKSITSHFEVLLGIGFTFPRTERQDRDPDGDGFLGAADACPTVRGVRPDGCPTKDTDGDGIDDRDDSCPDVRGVAPDGCPPKDSDSDGVPDRQDACPDEAGSPAAGGCPDGDGDGVPDQNDVCPDRAGEKPSGCPGDDPDGDGVLGEADRCPTVKGVAPSGCPDGDGDGIPDAEDKCPTERETLNGYEDDDGCPDEIPAALDAFVGTIEGINFATGSARIQASSNRLLDRAVKVLKDFPRVRLEIDGHTDNTGDHDKNVKLSLARAQAVKNYLVAKGIAEDRLTAKGFGPDRPLETNKTRAGRAKNRRIEFQLIP